MEQCLAATSEGRGRKEREAGRREEELTAALRAEDARITKEQEISEKTTTYAATSASSSDPRPPAPENVAPEVRQSSEVADRPSAEMQVDPMAASDKFATDRTPMDIGSRDDRGPPTSARANKKIKPTSDSQRQVDERAPAQLRNMSSPGVGTDQKRPRVPEPSSPTVSYKSDEPEDADMEDRKIISSVLRGVDITEVYLPQRVVEVCHRYKLIQGDSFDLRTGFDLSDPAVHQRVSWRIVETNAVLVILRPPCTKLSTLQPQPARQRA